MPQVVVCFFLKKRAEQKEYRRTLFYLKSLFLICTMVTALLQNYNCKMKMHLGGEGERKKVQLNKRLKIKSYAFLCLRAENMFCILLKDHEARM